MGCGERESVREVGGQTESFENLGAELVEAFFELYVVPLGTRFICTCRANPISLAHMQKTLSRALGEGLSMRF